MGMKDNEARQNEEEVHAKPALRENSGEWDRSVEMESPRAGVRQYDHQGGDPAPDLY
jgi:hypothetical protein